MSGEREALEAAAKRAAEYLERQAPRWAFSMAHEIAAQLRAALATAGERGAEGADLSLGDLRTANVRRDREWDPDRKITLLWRATELAGEVGEACNVAKKMARERAGMRGSRAEPGALAQELADVVICADLLAMDEGIDLAAAVIAKFNASSEKLGLRQRLPLSLPAPAREGAHPPGGEADTYTMPPPDHAASILRDLVELVEGKVAHGTPLYVLMAQARDFLRERAPAPAPAAPGACGHDYVGKTSGAACPTCNEPTRRTP